MYAMGLCGLILATLVALGAALGFFSTGPDASARLAAEHYSQARSVVLRAVQDGARRSVGLAPGTVVLAGISANQCLAPWSKSTDCAIPLTAAGVTLFAPPAWLAPVLPDGSPRWAAQMAGGRLFVYGPATAKEMAAAQTASRRTSGMAWCPAGATKGSDCTPKLLVLENGILVEDIALPSGLSGSATTNLLAVTELALPPGP